MARGRVALTLAAAAAVFIERGQPSIGSWNEPAGWFAMHSYMPYVFGLHAVYSLGTLWTLGRGLLPAVRVGAVTPWVDVAFATVVTAMTEGAISPFTVFFNFAVVSAGLRGNRRQTTALLVAGVGLYSALIVVAESAPHTTSYLLRPVGLGIIGYMMAHVVRQRLRRESELERLTAAEARHRVARDLHDGWAQAFAATILRVARSRKMLQHGRAADVEADLADLESAIGREYDQLREYMRDLAGVSPAAEADDAGDAAVRVTIDAEFAGPASTAERVLHVLREAVTNVRRHSQARVAAISVRPDQAGLAIHIDDDGVGFRSRSQRPWTISSHVHEMGGKMEIGFAEEAGAHIRIHVPAAGTGK